MSRLLSNGWPDPDAVVAALRQRVAREATG
jgi:hypothetical protein